MTVVDTHARLLTGIVRTPRDRHYLMCPPAHFEVAYAINPWMDVANLVDVDRARQQWEVLRDTYLRLGHRVDLIDPLPGQPDMVFAANGALVIGGRAYGAMFRFPERAAEGGAYAAWLSAQGYRVHEPRRTNEGEGDFLALGSMILAGTGFRTSLEAHIELAEALDRPVVSLELVDPRFYHLDVAIAVLDDGNGTAPADIAYFPGAFSRHSRRTLRDLFPDALLCSEEDARVLGLNAVSDGHHVVLPAAATSLAASLRRRGYTPVPVVLDEFLKAGGSVKCCTMEMHR
ncbi:dimethylargininase [Aeromicrobium wangtongii]|uniref:dimethylargininase n=1 Tax=Aeromicrobium wangtongii TaxID=2969247 RepID=UPI0020172A61|nr:dimethylargininase [Aeromicrobium wangtongii]MCL3819718.1 N-dimethylarginine dimethylaminohydrolase [Aeromicrobium wangtongii]